MTPRSSALALLTAASLLGLPACSKSEAPASAPSDAPQRVGWKPSAPVNVILIVIDTLRADAVLDPDGHYDTPNIDRLVSEGVSFPRAFSAAPMTLPSHASLFSSRDPYETKVLNNGQDVPKGLPLLAEWLEQHGYDTRGVISLGTLNPPSKGPGISRGFGSYDHDYWCMAQAENTHGRLLASLDKRDVSDQLFLFAHFSDPHEPYNAHGTEHTEIELRMDGEPFDRFPISDMAFWKRSLPLSEGRTVFEFAIPGDGFGQFRIRLFQGTEDGEPLDVDFMDYQLMDRVRSAVLAIDRKERAEASCDLQAWINDVPPSDDSRRSRYAQEVAYVDRYVGELLKDLQDRGLYEDSLIVFTSDHGEAMGEPRMQKGRPFFGHAQHLTDEQIHVPLVIRLPRNDPRRAELEAAAKHVVSHLDLVPTLLEIVGVDPLPGQRGVSLFEPHKTVHIAQTMRPEAKSDQVALRDSHYKMIFYPGESESGPDRFELYDLEKDPGETLDVFPSEGAVRPEWPARLRKLYQQSGGKYEEGNPLDDRENQKTDLNALGYGGDDEE